VSDDSPLETSSDEWMSGLNLENTIKKEVKMKLMPEDLARIMTAMERGEEVLDADYALVKDHLERYDELFQALNAHLYEQAFLLILQTTEEILRLESWLESPETRKKVSIKREKYYDLLNEHYALLRESKEFALNPRKLPYSQRQKKDRAFLKDVKDSMRSVPSIAKIEEPKEDCPIWTCLGAPKRRLFLETIQPLMEEREKLGLSGLSYAQYVTIKKSVGYVFEDDKRDTLAILISYWCGKPSPD
jgi:hypothetical protein